MAQGPERGFVVGGRYRLESILGEGGMAVVWNAFHTETDRKVALKLVRPGFVRDRQVREMFVREARMGARIGKNDHIVDVLDAGVDPVLEVPFIAMELLEGEGLDHRVARGPIPASLVADLLEQLADALDQAHGAGVYHRDLKPQNIFLGTDRKGRPLLKVLDFGIAKLSESTQAAVTNVGTPAYAAPEQLGEAWQRLAKTRSKSVALQVSAATDIWAVGLITFEMLSGIAPNKFWGAETLAELPVKTVLEPVPAASTRTDPALLPPGFDAWIARCLEVDATKRFPTIREAVDAIVPALRTIQRAGAPTTGPVASQPMPVPPTLASTPPQAPQAPSPPQRPMTNAAPLPTPLGMPPIARPPQGPPPGPPRWGGPTPGAPVGPPVAPLADPTLAAWAARWRADTRAPGDPREYQMAPVHFMPRVESVTREARVPLATGARPATLVVAEVTTSDQFRKMMFEERMLVGLVRAPHIAYRAAFRTKRAGGVVDGVSRGLKALDSLFISAPGPSLINDPTFESHYDVWAPSPHEAQMAIPVTLRQLVMSGGFRGIIERSHGMLFVTSFDLTKFEPIDLDRMIDVCNRALAVI